MLSTVDQIISRSRPFSGQGTYWLSDGQSSVSLGWCDDCAALEGAVEQVISACGDDEPVSWDGWRIVR